MYLTLDAIHAALATMAQSRPGSRVVLTYNQPPAVLAGSTAQIAAAFAGRAAEMGEPFISRFLPGEIARLLHEHDLARSPTSRRTRREPFTSPGRGDVEIAGAQRLVAATLAPASALSGHSAGQRA
jgi:O-methyltransferase involved in polyketide biosynthesis